MWEKWGRDGQIKTVRRPTCVEFAPLQEEVLQVLARLFSPCHHQL